MWIFEYFTLILFNRYGRVNYVLAKRMELLEQVGRLQNTLNVTADASATCELAHHFYVYHVKPRWQYFIHQCNKKEVTCLYLFILYYVKLTYRIIEYTVK